MTPTLRQTAFGAGYAARESGAERDSVPYPANTFHWLDWLSGFDLASQMAELKERTSKEPGKVSE